MSKVYEALRRKEQENASKQAGNPINQELITGSNSGFDSEPRGVTRFSPTLPSTAAEAIPIDAAGRDLLPSLSLEVGARSNSNNGFRALRLPLRENSRLIFRTDPHGLAAEQFRLFRRTLEQKFPDGAILLITSPAPRDGKTLTALNLCACLAEHGRSTLLLEADIRQPTFCKVLEVTTNSPGIEDILAGTAEPGQVVQFLEDFSIHVAMVAKPPEDPSRLVSGAGPKELVSWARSHFDWVVIDSPPVLPAADVAQLLPLADAALLVIRARCTPRDLAARAFELVSGHLCGVVFNEATIDSNPYYRYLSDYGQKNYARSGAKPSGSIV